MHWWGWSLSHTGDIPDRRSAGKAKWKAVQAHYGRTGQGGSHTTASYHETKREVSIRSTL